MTPEAVLSLTGALLCAGLGLFVFLRETRSLVHRTFAVGMLALAAEAAVTALGTSALEPAEVMAWQKARLLAGVLGPGAWLLFSLTFARANYRSFIRRWRGMALFALAAPVALVTLGHATLFTGVEETTGSAWVLRLGPPGRVLHLVLLLTAVLVLMNLERTLRASTGSMLWRIKFMALGVGAIFAVRIYTLSQALLYAAADTSLQAIDAGGLIVGAVLVIVSLARNRLLNVDIYLSQSMLYGSLTVTVVGAYLLAVGVLAKAVTTFGGAHALPLATFVVFLALVGLAIVLLSGQLQHKLRRFVSRNFLRPRYDYRREWLDFARRTTSIVDARALCAAVTRMVSETLAVPSVTIWLLDEAQAQVELAASTVFSEMEGRQLLGESRGPLLDLLRGQGSVVEVPPQDRLRQAGIRWSVPLSSGGERMGGMTLGERLTDEPFTTEDLEVLKTIADQAAASIHNLRLSERLLQAKEMEAFQTLSAFFIHDLKNLASKLSLTLQNLPSHYDDPAFRQDLLSVISRSVAKINEMCGRLSPLSARLELGRKEADLNEVVASALSGLDGSLKGKLMTQLSPLPRAPLDPEQVQKVLVNLVLNANESLGEDGEIRVATREREGWLELTVSDNGCGMSEEFMNRSLFKPFQTTKRQGLGIGLFHARKIVEAHEGRIEVESGEGRGTTFRVLLPARGAGQAPSAA